MEQSAFDKAHDWKVKQYGEVAMKYRRGILTHEEAQYQWDSVEGTYLNILDSLRATDDPAVHSIIAKGLE